MKGLRRYLIACAIFLVGYLVAQYYKPKPTDWTASYLKEDKIPFGTYIQYHEIHDLFPGADVKISRDPIYNTLKGNKFKNTNYLFISSSMALDKLDLKELINYVQGGNNVFIATFDFGKVLSDILKLEVSSSFSSSKKGLEYVNFTNPSLKAKHNYIFNKGVADQYFSKFDTSKVTILGKSAEGNANFIKYSFGKGNVYILPNPKLLTNYSLLDPSGADYAAKALSYLPPSKNLIWDEHNTRGNVTDTSILRVLFKNEQLRWAYILALIGLLIFVLFEMKRRQRVIPIIEPLRNSSLDFVKVVGKVYYQQRDNSDIARKKVNYFLEFIRSTYHLKTTSLDNELRKTLGIRSGVPEETIDQLFAIINSMNSDQRVDDGLLINLNKLIEKFYKQAQ